MRRFASFVTIFVLLTTVAPVLACVTGGAMSREESECCRSMHGHCGEMAKMGCCQTKIRTDEAPQVAATSPATEVQWVVVAQLEASAPFARPIAGASLQSPEDYYPPGLVTAGVAVLRI